MGAYDFDGGDVGFDLYHGLYSLQHRGQESCGIVTNAYVRLNTVKGKGLVNEVFNKDNLATLKGNIGVGHVGYGTNEDGNGIPPIVSRYCKGTMTVAMNGVITNYDELRSGLEQRGAIFQSLSHTEMIMNLIAVARTQTHSAEEAVRVAVSQLKGAFSLIVMSPKKLIAARDPYGFRPLSVGKRRNTYYFTSETAALDVIRAERLFDVKPGEIIKIDENGVTHYDGASPRNAFSSTFTSRVPIRTSTTARASTVRAWISARSCSARTPSKRIWWSACPIRACTSRSAIPMRAAYPTASGL